GRGDALVAGAGNGAGGVLILGHLDTVWARGTLDGFPYRVEGDRASGPGVFDMKAGIAVAMDVMTELAKERAGDATLLLVPDEEIGSGASRALTLELAGRHRGVLVLEPSLGGAAQGARKGHGLLRRLF